MAAGRFLYSFGGFEIRSDVPLSGLVPRPSTEKALRIVVERSDAPISGDGPVLFRWPGRYGLTLRAHGSGWLLSTNLVAALVSGNGRLVRTQPVAHAPGWTEVLVRRILPRLAQWHGRLALHAAAVTDGSGAILLLGPSGAGKSTLAAALCRLGPWRPLSDDISLLDGDAHRTGRPRSWPSGTGLCLWPDSLSAVATSPDGSRPIAGHVEKRWLGVGPYAAPAGPSRVVATVLLTPDDPAALAIRPVAESEAAQWAGAQMVVFNPADHSLMAQSWGAVGRLVTEVPTFTLSYPRRYEVLPEVASTLSAEFLNWALTTA